MKELVARQDLFFLIPTRDPIERFVSAFNWDRRERPQLLVDGGPGGIWKRIYATFPSANDLAEALSSEDTAERELAHAAFRESFLHMHLGLSWYLPLEVARMLPAERSAVIRVDHIDEDFASFAVKFGMPRPARFFPLPHEKAARDRSGGLSVRHLSELARSNLRCMLDDDYRVIECLRERGLSGERVAPPDVIHAVVRGSPLRVFPDSFARLVKWQSRRVLHRLVGRYRD